jgi:hypothetical protein
LQHRAFDGTVYQTVHNLFTRLESAVHETVPRALDSFSVMISEAKNGGKQMTVDGDGGTKTAMGAMNMSPCCGNARKIHELHLLPNIVIW